MMRVRSFALAILLVAGVVSSAHATAIVCIDGPTAGAGVPQQFMIGGWSLDPAASANNGVPFLHIWAYPGNGGPPQWIAEVHTGVSRPDVAAAFGYKSQFTPSGFNWIVDSLSPGQWYLLAVFPYNSLKAAFDPPLARWVYVQPSTATTGTLLRVLQWNTHHGGFGTDGVYSPDRLATWAASFRPDVISFNEIEKNDYWGNQDQPEVYTALLQQKTGKTWYYVFAQEFGQWSSNGKGNLILSTYPLNSIDRYEFTNNYDRSVALAQITVNGRNVTLMSTHLDPYDATLRLTQATELTGWAAGQAENRIIAGDLNAWPDQTSIAYVNAYYNDTWAVAASAGTAVAFAGNNGETMKGRIDYIYASKGSPNLVVRSSQVYDTRDANGITPSDHRPVLTVIEVR
jgi:endonuclease/exonuclease/phosphatase family metal-dependent hydrolase